MSDFYTVNTTEEIHGWYIKLLDLDDVKVDKKAILTGIINRGSIAVSIVEPTIKDISNTDKYSYIRNVQPDGKTYCYVAELQIATCADTRNEILVAVVVGFNPRPILPTSDVYKLSVSGQVRDGLLTEIDYFTIEEDKSDTHKRLAITHLTTVKDWCKSNK